MAAAAVEDDGDVFVLELLGDLLGGLDVGVALGAEGRHGQRADVAAQQQGDGVVGHAHADGEVVVAEVSGHLRIAGQHDRERPGPAPVHHPAGGVGDGGGQVQGLPHRGHEDGQVLLPGPPDELEEAVGGSRHERVDGQDVDGVGREGHGQPGGQGLLGRLPAHGAERVGGVDHRSPPGHPDPGPPSGRRATRTRSRPARSRWTATAS